MKEYMARKKNKNTCGCEQNLVTHVVMRSHVWLNGYIDKQENEGKIGYIN